MKKIAGTGTRSIQKLSVPEKSRVLEIITEQLNLFGELDAANGGDGKIIVISGMAEGFDSALAMAAISVGMELHCYIPNRGYGNYYWGQKSQTGQNRLAQFNAIVAQAAHVEYTNEKLGVNSLYHNGVHMNFLRNQHMVDDADILFAWATSEKEADGGTRDCICRWLTKREAAGPEHFPIVYLKKGL